MKMLARAKAKYRLYKPLIKPLQTGLLVITGLTGYVSARCPMLTTGTILSLAASLFLAISGSTILNMWWDRDIDALMKRTQRRSTAAGQVTPNETLLLGLLVAGLGLAWAFSLDLLFGSVVAAGLFFDVVVYTIWLKRRTAWSILWGGLAGGMPILAGRALGAGRIDTIGLVLALAVLFWIPTHIMTFNLRHQEDYDRAGVPTFPSAYGVHTTHITIALSSVLAAIAMGLGAYGIRLTWGYMRLLFVLSGGLLILAIYSMTNPSLRLNFGLFKYASLYMLGSMLMMAGGVL
ncbi:MAG: protoheme IX farnesyltransferase [Anaerolineales bacterium]